MKTIKTSEIIIPGFMRDSIPRKEKVDKIRAYVDEYNEIDKPIVLSEENVLTDSYIRYLIAVEKGFKEVPYVTDREYKKKRNDNKLVVGDIVKGVSHKYNITDTCMKKGVVLRVLDGGDQIKIRVLNHTRYPDSIGSTYIVFLEEVKKIGHVKEFVLKDFLDYISKRNFDILNEYDLYNANFSIIKRLKVVLCIAITIIRLFSKLSKSDNKIRED